MKRIKSFFISKLTVDTIAFAIFSLLTSVGLTTIYELLVLKMDNDDWILFRIIYNVLKFSGAYFCAELTDIIRKKIQKNPNSLSQKITADTLAVSIYQLPIYNITGYFIGIETYQLIIISTIFLIDNILSGWSYGVILDWVRKKI